MKRLVQSLRRRWLLLLAAITPPCRSVVRLGLGEEPGSRNPMVRARVRVHLAICDPCARYLRQVSWLGLAARSSVERPEFTVRGVRETRLAEAAKRRLRGRIRGDVRGGPSSP